MSIEKTFHKEMQMIDGIKRILKVFKAFQLFCTVLLAYERQFLNKRPMCTFFVMYKN